MRLLLHKSQLVDLLSLFCVFLSFCTLGASTTGALAAMSYVIKCFDFSLMNEDRVINI